MQGGARPTHARGRGARYEALAPVAIGMLVFSLADLAGANVFLAGFAGGSTVSSVTA